ncbi:FMN-binding protein [Brachybacterium huguangmaarense]|uniref:FMN-binding protein n=1 Tax=Brachybacterium huguangmaarense TaxID=1652028 RepID=A0ABY6FZ79_9MICO|nr:FMN-binding protein [Brachybacterium huguangmaarense]UYG16236.1 FMN-binding protein [Brachybacterium huguangmaarense]
MKKIVYWVMATVTGVVLLFSYRTSLGADLTATTTPDTVSSPDSLASPDTSTGDGGAPSKSDGGGATSSQDSSVSGFVDGSYTGSAARTRYGDVQVQITVSGGRITDVQVPVYPDANGRDRQINAHAIPQLVAETTEAQNADIQMVSGATYTSSGYTQSLQSALDQARA